MHGTLRFILSTKVDVLASFPFNPEDGGTITGTDIDTKDDVKDEADDLVVVEFVLGDKDDGTLECL